MAGTRRELWDEAQRLVVHEGQSYADAAAATGLPLSTLQKRACAEQWQEQRDASLSYSAQVRLGKARALKKLTDLLADEKAVADDIAKVASVWRGIETAFPEHRYNAKADPRQKLEVTVLVVEELVTYLAERDTAALAALRPHLRDFAGHMETRCAA